jgi:hypothetical protein
LSVTTTAIWTTAVVVMKVVGNTMAMTAGTATTIMTTMTSTAATTAARTTMTRTVARANTTSMIVMVTTTRPRQFGEMGSLSG